MYSQTRSENLKATWVRRHLTETFRTPSQRMKELRTKPKWQKYYKNYYKRMQELWLMHKSNMNKFDFQKIELQSENILKKYGFTNVYKCTVRFAGDFIATYNGKECLVEVTTAISHSLVDHKNLCKRLGLDLYVLFVRKDFKYNFLKKVDITDSKKSLALSMKELKTCG